MVTSIYWGGLAIGRLRSCPEHDLHLFNCLGDLIGCSVSAFLLLFPLNDTIWWTMSGLYGLAMASIFPTVINSALFYTTVDGPATSAMVVGASGDMTIH